MARQRIKAKANVGAGTEDFYMDQIGTDFVPVTKILLGDDDVDDGFVHAGNPMPVNLASQPLPTGAATETTLAALNTKTPALGQAAMAASQPVVIASNQSSIPVIATDPSTTVSFGPVSNPDTALFAAVDTADESTIQLQITGNFNRGGVTFEASNNGTNYSPVLATTRSDEQLVDTIYAPDLVTLPVTGKFFRAKTTPDFSGSVSGVYSLRFMDTPTPFTKTKLVDVSSDIIFPISGFTPSGFARPIAVADNGGVTPADGATIIGASLVGAPVGTVVLVDTTGYGSVALQLAGTFTGTITFQVSNNGSSWQSTVAWPSAGGAAPVTTTTAAGQWVIPAAGRFIRAQVTTAGTGQVIGIATLKNASAFYPASTPSVTIAANSAVNVAQIGGTGVVTGGVAGIQAVGGNIAVGAAPTANPVPIGGWDGTNTRRILTDAVSGGVALGANGASNGASPATLISAATNNLTQIKATLGKLHLIDCVNSNASLRYLKLFNVPSASVTMGTTNATMNFPIPVSGGRLQIQTSLGLNLGGSGISIALTGGSALNDNTAIGAGDVIANFMFV